MSIVSRGRHAGPTAISLSTSQHSSTRGRRHRRRNPTSHPTADDGTRQFRNRLHPRNLRLARPSEGPVLGTSPAADQEPGGFHRAVENPGELLPDSHGLGVGGVSESGLESAANSKVNGGIAEESDCREPATDYYQRRIRPALLPGDPRSGEIPDRKSPGVVNGPVLQHRENEAF